MAHQHQIAGAEHGGEHVIEIVRDAACQLAHRLHLGGLGDLALEAGFDGGVGEPQQNCRLAEAAHPGKAQRNRLVGLVLEANGNIARSNRAEPEAADSIRQGTLVFLHHQIGRVGRRRLAFAQGGAHEGGIGEQQPPVAISHGEAERKLGQQGFEVRRGSADFAATSAQPRAGISEQQQRGRGGGIGIAGRIGVGQRQVIERERRALAAFARPGETIGLFLQQERNEFLARHCRLRIAGSAKGKAGAGGHDHACRIDDGGGDPGLRQGAAEFALQLIREFRRKIGRDNRQEAPDQKILAAPAASCFRPPAAGWAVEQIGRAAAIAPGSARGAGQAFERGCVDWQQWRGVGNAEPCLIAGIGADQSPGAVGDGNARVGAVDRGDSNRPVGQGQFGTLRGRRTAAQGQHHAGQRD